MGIVNEIKHVYKELNNINRYELNSIIAERISNYSYRFLNEDEISAIKSEFGSVETFSSILAESFTRNNGSFDNISINEGVANEGIWGGIAKLFKGGKRLITKGGKGLIRRATGKPAVNVVARFGKNELSDIAKFTGKSVKNIGHTDIAKYVTRNMTKNANRNVAKQLEKQAAWLSKNTNMNAKQMEVFMQKYAKCPADCDPKIWKQAFEQEAKLFNGSTKMENGLVRARYNAIARASGKTGRSIVSSAGKTTLTRRMLDGIKKFGKRAIIWKFIKIGGIIYLLYLGHKYLWDKIKGWVEEHLGISSNGGSGLIGNEMNDIYPKIYGKDYLSENPEDYRII